MSAFLLGWGVFWLLVWIGALGTALMPPRSHKDAELAGCAVLGAFLAIAWIVGVLVWRAAA